MQKRRKKRRERLGRLIRRGESERRRRGRRRQGKTGRESQMSNCQATCMSANIDFSSFDDSEESEDEGIPDYKIGGYHPVHVG